MVFRPLLQTKKNVHGNFFFFEQMIIFFLIYVKDDLGDTVKYVTSIGDRIDEIEALQHKMRNRERSHRDS